MVSDAIGRDILRDWSYYSIITYQVLLDFQFITVVERDRQLKHVKLLGPKPTRRQRFWTLRPEAGGTGALTLI
jgi:hypothetical protein